MNDFVWLIGGSIMQAPMLDEIHKRGFNAIVSDYNPNCYLFSKLTPFDWKVVADTYSITENVGYARSLPKDLHVRGVVAPGIDVGPTASAIAERLGLRAVPYQIARDVRDKSMMRWKLNAEHPHYDTFLCAVDTNFQWWLREGNLPCVIKPVDNCATRGISVAYDKAEFDAGVVLALQSNKHSSAVVVEEMLHGTEVALDFLIVDGEAVWVNGTSRLFRHHKPGTQEQLFGIEGAVINPFGPHSVSWNNLSELATYAARQLGVTEGPFKIDAILDNNYGWCILECATRLSGGFDHMFMAPMVGRDITSVLLDYALGLEPIIPLVLPNRYVASYMPYYAPQKIKRWEWVYSETELEESFGVKHVFIRAEHEINELKTCADRVAWFLAEDSTPLRALRNACLASKYVVPIPLDMNGDQ